MTLAKKDKTKITIKNKAKKQSGFEKLSFNLPDDNGASRSETISIDELIALNTPPEDGFERARSLSTDKHGQHQCNKCCIDHHMAVVSRNGNLVRGCGVWRTRRIWRGVYEVIFNEDISQGVFNATIGSPAYAIEFCGHISVALQWSPNQNERNKGVLVIVQNTKCELVDKGFHLVVHS